MKSNALIAIFSALVLTLFNGVLAQEEILTPKSILDYELKDILDAAKELSFVVFYRESDLLSKNVLKNVTLVMNLINTDTSLSFYSVNIDKNKKQIKRLGLKSFPCGIYLKGSRFYKYSFPFETSNLYSFLSSNYLSTSSYSLPRSLNLFQYSLQVVQDGFKGHWVFTFNLVIMLGFFISMLIYFFRHLFSTSEASPSSKSLKTN